MAVKVDLRLMLDRAFVAAKNSGVGFNVAAIPASFNAPSRGAFDPDYMKALFDVGYDQGKSAKAFAAAPPPYPDQSAIESDGAAKPTDRRQTGSDKMTRLGGIVMTMAVAALVAATAATPSGAAARKHVRVEIACL